MTKYILLLLAFAFLNVASAEQNKTFDTEALFNLERISSFSLSPDGKNVVTVVTNTDMKENTFTSQIHLIDVNSKETTQLTSSGNHNNSPIWDATGENIYFLSDRSESMQTWKINISGGEASQVTDIEDGIGHIQLSHNGKYLSYAKDVALDSTVVQNNPDLEKVNALIYDELMARHWDSWSDEKYRHIFIYDLETKESVDILEGERFESPMKPFGGASDYDWSPDSKRIAYTCKKVDDYEKSTNSDLYIYNISTKKTRNVTEGMIGYDKHPKWSPDGKLLAFESMERAGYESDRNRLMIYDFDSEEIKELTKNLDQPVSKTIWAESGRGLYFLAPNGKGTNQIYFMKLDGTFEILTSGQSDNGLRGFDEKNNSVLFSKENFNNPPELFIYSTKTKKSKQITFFNDEAMKKFDDCKVVAKWTKSTDGKNVHNWIIYPPNFDKNKKYPMLVYCQGGPQQQVSQYFSYGWSMKNFASKGYIVIAPNRRGCPGFGQDWTDAIGQDYGGMPMVDIVESAKAEAQNSYVDKSKIAAIGASAGGYMTFWLAGHNEDEFFSAFITHCGIFNKVSMYGSTEELFFPNYDNGGPYWQNKDYYEANSPHNFVTKWNKPILIITGVKDFRVPYTQSLEGFTGARAQNIPARLLVFPDENHWILKPQEKVLWYREFYKFLDESLSIKTKNDDS
jgi:dipeptidyl aminopeptidase/acylaminoacyl peptidase